MSAVGTDDAVRLRSLHVGCIDDGVDANFPRLSLSLGDVDDNDRKSKESTATAMTNTAVAEPLKLPMSTYTLLFTQPVLSLPFLFAVGIASISFACLFLAEYDLFLQDGFSHVLKNNIPANVEPTVRAAQYLAIIICFLLEEEIPTGLYLLRMIPRASFEKKFPEERYIKFVLSALLRVILGYLFILNVLIVVVQATGVLEIFYDIMALKFVQQLDDIAFSLAKMDVLGRRMQQACTAKCFQTKYERKKKLWQSKSISTLKAVYFINPVLLLAAMATVSYRQYAGHYQSSSITVDFGNEVWEKPQVKMPREHYEKFNALHPYFGDILTPDTYQNWTLLVFSYFNGYYEQVEGETYDGRPIYRERRKFNRSPYEVITPAEIKYCRGISAWVFTHEHIRKAKKEDERGCNWLLRSPETTEFDLLNVDSNWKIWLGVVGDTTLSYVSNECIDEIDCNMNGICEQGECKCNQEDGVKYLGTHCEVTLTDSCRTIIGESSENLTYSVSEFRDPTNVYVLQQYSRPVYILVSWADIGPSEGDIAGLVFTGSRWFTYHLPSTGLNMADEYSRNIMLEHHAFWGRRSLAAVYVSDPTKKDTPVGVDFFRTEEHGKQFGPFGALSPMQKHNQTGRGFFRCAGSSSLLYNVSDDMSALGENQFFKP